MLLAFAVWAQAREIRQGDSFYAKRAEEGMAEKAAQEYRKALAIDPGEEAYWKLSRASFWIGTHERDREKKTRIFKDGAEYAKLAIEANPDSVPAHYWLGVQYGLYGEAKGISQSLSLVDPIMAEMRWVIKHQESYSSGGAHRVLGRVYFKLPGLYGGSNAKAIQHLKRSIEIEPINHLSRLYLAEVYLAEGDKAAARKELQRVIDDPPDPEWEPETKEQKEEAKRILREIAP